MSKRKKNGKRVSGNPAKRVLGPLIPKPKIPASAIPIEEHTDWTYLEDIDSRIPYVEVKRRDGTTQIYEGKSARTFKQRASGKNLADAHAAVDEAARERFRSYMAGEAESLAPALLDGPFVTCECGCNEYYPERWLSEVAPVVFKVLTDGNRAMLENMPQAGYVEAGNDLPGTGGQEAVFLLADNGMGINIVTADTLLEAGRHWNKDKMNSFADFVVDACAAACAAYDVSRRGGRRNG